MRGLDRLRTWSGRWIDDDGRWMATRRVLFRLCCTLRFWRWHGSTALLGTRLREHDDGEQRHDAQRQRRASHGNDGRQHQTAMVRFDGGAASDRRVLQSFEQTGRVRFVFVKGHAESQKLHFNCLRSSMSNTSTPSPSCPARRTQALCRSSACSRRPAPASAR